MRTVGTIVYFDLAECGIAFLGRLSNSPQRQQRPILPLRAAPGGRMDYV
jgi:hypothetical protein